MERVACLVSFSFGHGRGKDGESCIVELWRECSLDPKSFLELLLKLGRSVFCHWFGEVARL